MPKKFYTIDTHSEDAGREPNQRIWLRAQTLDDAIEEVTRGRLPVDPVAQIFDVYNRRGEELAVSIDREI